MKGKILNLLLVITSLFGYLEWSGNNHSFLYEAESDLFTKLFSDPRSVLHPFILLPLLGQVLLLTTLFQKAPNKRMIYFSIGCLGLLLGFMLFIGLYTKNFRIVVSTIPFLVTALFAIRYYRKNGIHTSQ